MLFPTQVKYSQIKFLKTVKRLDYEGYKFDRSSAHWLPRWKPSVDYNYLSRIDIIVFYVFYLKSEKFTHQYMGELDNMLTPHRLFMKIRNDVDNKTTTLLIDLGGKDIC